MTRGETQPNKQLGSSNKTESDNSQVGFLFLRKYYLIKGYFSYLCL